MTTAAIAISTLLSRGTVGFSAGADVGDAVEGTRVVFTTDVGDAVMEIIVGTDVGDIEEGVRVVEADLGEAVGSLRVAGTKKGAKVVGSGVAGAEGMHERGMQEEGDAQVLGRGHTAPTRSQPNELEQVSIINALIITIYFKITICAFLEGIAKLV